MPLAKGVWGRKTTEKMGRRPQVGSSERHIRQLSNEVWKSARRSDRKAWKPNKGTR